MKNIKYLFIRIKNLDYKNFFNYINKVNKKTNKNKIFIFFDTIYCGIKYQAGYMDYYLFEMYDMNKQQRSTVLTRGKNNMIIKYFNDKKYFNTFLYKPKFNEKFKKFINRDWILINENSYEKFLKFTNGKVNFIAKPIDGTCGKGIEKINVDETDKKELFNYLIQNKINLLEENITQHDDVNKMYPHSINTIRVITLYNNKNNKSTVFSAYFRIGNNNKFVDNFNSGGMVVPIDVKTGEIKYNALDKDGNLYDKHPMTQTNIKGYVIPKWDEIIKFSKKLALVEKNIGIVGWDIAVTNKGLDVVEGNEFPGHDIYQLPPHRTDNIGVIPEFEKALNNIGLTKKDIF